MAQLTEVQRHQLIALLDEQEARLHRQLNELESAPPADAAPAMETYEDADLADLEAAERATDMMRNHYRTELAQIVVARERLAQGRYGLCVDCGEAIPFLRLQAQPTAQCCVACQRKRERRWA
ncbi:TraR/DksA family transcriptional regulator (plasmid) [Ralstonia syzygii subsp. celebesensis]|uniref:Conjugal transfer protein TraR n=4 Tax=Ralstonia solanacearum species complex TaxID=3116862 RepID=A0AAD0S712_RALSL|nr:MULTISPECIES: TraR/DksA family transcriptional regulator [Ralstonia solanacearum species complex]CCA83224.1 putative dnak suppressor protein [blood disease bacterium R229]AQW32338.1 conjugal transfer protein TraR [blood disease bacterium A2-HR MARDI]AXV81323.1 conjugal transfer protein TraR [Ralstonia solanacearum]AXW52460.1 conjugal transfer protein TraR [Ralstonia solanacearum]QQV57817.1 TraR/DksA family transcriptional regulator [Ralstonia syzygii subsp. celebesensis]